MRKHHNADFARTPAQAALNERLLTWRLAPGDTVVIAGGYDGVVSDLLLERYPGIEVYLFEPQVTMAHALADRYLDEGNVHVAAFGLGVETGLFPMVAAGSDAASFIVPRGAAITGYGDLREWSTVMADLGIQRIALLHLNIEGYEHLLLPHLVRSGWLPCIDQLAVSTHPLPSPLPGIEQWDAIAATIAQTHRALWHATLGWFAYERREGAER